MFAIPLNSSTHAPPSPLQKKIPEFPHCKASHHRRRSLHRPRRRGTGVALHGARGAGAAGALRR